MNGKTFMYKAKTLWERMGWGEQDTKHGGEYDVDWNDVAVLAESFNGDQMTQCVANDKIVTL